MRPGIRKIVFILHSQGGIQGGLVFDLLLAELPKNFLEKLEVYTFGDAANHFATHGGEATSILGGSSQGVDTDTGHDDQASTQPKSYMRAIGHIEHYASRRDFFSLWGVLNFVRLPNAYSGRVFECEGRGHLFIQHYTDYMFPLRSTSRGGYRTTRASNEFMESEIEFRTDRSIRSSTSNDGNDDGGREENTFLQIVVVRPLTPYSLGLQRAASWSVSDSESFLRKATRVKDVSRLSGYRNGMSLELPLERRGFGEALQASSVEGHEKIVELLLNKGAHVNAQGGGFGNALQAGSAEGHEKIVELLLNKGADINAE
ncbi:hypothetical protein LTR28_006810, partial [Elasticomyces elasticus]